MLVWTALLVLAVSGVAVAAKPAPFPGGALLPGDTVSTTFTVAATGRAASTQLLATHVQQSCVAPDEVDCPSAPGDLAQELQLSVSTADGQLWRGTLADLEDGVTLPRSNLPPGHARTFGLELSLPASADNSFQYLGFSAKLTWTPEGPPGRPAGPSGGRSIGTAVLGEKISHGGEPHDTSLPFTGFDVALTLLVAMAAIAAGSTTLAAARRRLRR